ncbi:MAG: dockerin type I repeat-containing protein, partial [Lachnospiraceae bacterium]|nr:dockerin type I repeat-containing protein [Lachnospiraceae bacterium]
GDATVTIYGDVNYIGNVVKTFNIIEDKPPVPENITSTKFSISQDELIVSKVTVGTTVSDLLNGIEQEEYVKVYSKSGILQAENAVLATGMTIRLMDEDEIIKSYTIIVTGDTNGDGTINITDMMATKAHVLKKTLLTGNASLAGDTNGDGKINITDFMAIKAHILKKASIQGVAIN